MKHGALIIGSSAAGLQAALDLADSGVKVDLVNGTHFLGNEGFESVTQHLLNARLLEIIKHPNIEVWTSTKVGNIGNRTGEFKVELRRQPRYVDLTRCTACGDCIEVCPVTVPGTGQKGIFLDGQPECAAIEKAGKAPCANTCPGEINVQGYVALISQGRFQEAIDLIWDAIPFPGICGRVCTHPCEINCRRAEIDQPVAIRLLKRFLADWALKHDAKPHIPDHEVLTSQTQKVAVVGAGPGGMAAADKLARMGYQVTVFEKLPVIGGMMTIGIPKYRLPYEVTSQEYEYIHDLGVDIQLNTPIGADGKYSLDDLFDMGYQAVCLAIGAHKSLNLNIPGEDLTGVIHGIELLKMINFSQQFEDDGYLDEVEKLLYKGEDTRVAVLGGGNTAMDVSRSLKRLGVKDVRVLYRRTRDEMPAMPEEIEDAEFEGVQIEFLTSPVQIIGDENNRVSGLECIRTELGELDESGRRKPIPIEGSEFITNLDVFVLAIGQSPDLSRLGGAHKIKVTPQHRIVVDDKDFMTNQPSVFAVGDVITQDKVAVIEAIGMGKKAAEAIDAYLQGKPLPSTKGDLYKMPVSLREMTEDELVSKPRSPVRKISKKRRASSFDEVEICFSAKKAIAEAQRCLVCGPCSECMACVEVCKHGALIHEEKETITKKTYSTIISAEKTVDFTDLFPTQVQGIYHVSPEDALQGSSAAAQAISSLGVDRQKNLYSADAPEVEHPRIGVLVCQCGGLISNVVDVLAVCDQAGAQPGVVHTQSLPNSCTFEARIEIEKIIHNHALDKLVLAGCSCCSVDQVCYSCTYQRVRCRENLGVFGSIRSSDSKLDKPGAIEFVNIREQCAWVHADDPQAATTKAIILISAAAAKAKSKDPRISTSRSVERSVLVLGTGSAGRACLDVLDKQEVSVLYLEDLPQKVTRHNGQYVVSKENSTWMASALVFAPRNKRETKTMLAALDMKEEEKPQTGGGLGLFRPGIFYCDLKGEGNATGRAAAIRALAWLGKQENGIYKYYGLVDQARCRGCGTCVDVCEFGAPELVGDDAKRYSWIDPSVCMGCGVCAAHCPSGAITAGYSTDEQLSLMLKATLKAKAEERGSLNVVVFTCNWHAYAGLEAAGREHLSYPSTIYPHKVTCLGRMNPGIILKVFESGADGVLLLGCPPGECRYQTGNRHAEDLFIEAKDLVKLLGYGDHQLKLENLAAGQGKEFVYMVRNFIDGLNGNQDQ